MTQFYQNLLKCLLNSNWTKKDTTISVGFAKETSTVLIYVGPSRGVEKVQINETSSGLSHSENIGTVCVCIGRGPESQDQGEFSEENIEPRNADLKRVV